MMMSKPSSLIINRFRKEDYFVCFLKLSITGAPIVKLGTK